MLAIAGDESMAREIADEYLKFADTKVRFCEKVTGELFGRSIKHILLLHANELNADNFDRLIAVFRNRGYQFISLTEALQDPVYRFPDQYKATSDWLSLWSFSKGKQFEAPMPPEFIQKIYSESLQTGRLSVTPGFSPVTSGGANGETVLTVWSSS